MKRDKSGLNHIWHFQYLATEKLKNGERTAFSKVMKDIFVFLENETKDLKSDNNLARRIIRTTQYGIEK